MQIVNLNTNDLKAYASNSRTHSNDQIIQIADSITRFGFTNPILVDGTSEIIAGHGRVMAAKRLELEQVPCIVLDHLTESEKRAYVIADNKLALNADWSEDLLISEINKLLADGYDVSATGFADSELDKLLGQDIEDLEDYDDDGDLPQALQLEPPREYALIMCETFDEWEKLKEVLNLTPVRRGGYKEGSAFDSVGTQRVVTASDLFDKMGVEYDHSNTE